jgi:hypothetical protein
MQSMVGGANSHPAPPAAHQWDTHFKGSPSKICLKLVEVPGPWKLSRFWCKQAAIGDDGRMQRFVPVEALFKGRHFDGQIIIL